MNQAIISVGSNIEAEKNIQKARQYLMGQFEVMNESEFIETEPIGNLSQPHFINGTFLIRTDLSQQGLKIQLQAIETKLGRDRCNGPDAARTIDLDIIVWNDDIIDDDVYKRDYLRELVSQVTPNI